MNLSSKETAPPLTSAHGEIIYELIGTGIGDSTDLHSMAYIVIPPGKSSLLHYHPIAEESYYFLKGEGKLLIENKETIVSPGQAVLIQPTKKHKIFSIGKADLEFLAFCVPAWEPTNTVFLETLEDKDAIQ
jgi:mannose-6-phosphate isomerase-like protein (cupin superfamily)